jgi:hypothetical protein
VGGVLPPIPEGQVEGEACLLLDDGRPLSEPGPLVGLGQRPLLVIDGDRLHPPAPEATLLESEVPDVASVGAMPGKHRL